ncbi:MAG: GIY-YIG nuclease family protein [Patescibacteria group bacterium]|nr:GIY-YIG nuclease family protein [Patescibacteria group bacterium]
MIKGGFVYIMVNERPTIYTGVTNNLLRRVHEHKNNLVAGFTSKYNLHKLVYYESFETIEQAIIREKQIKDLNRDEKINLISKLNPKFKDLADGLMG